MSRKPPRLWRRSALSMRGACTVLVGIASALWLANAAATLELRLVRGSAEPDGFADWTPVEPVGGNQGKTLGEQRWNAVQRAADIWARALEGTPVVVAVSMPTLMCGVLGGTQSNGYLREGPKLDSNQVYSIALAEQIAGRNLNGTEPDILLELNGAICTPGKGAFYLGLDANVPAGEQSLTSTVLHELAHGFGFESLVNPADGAALMAAPGLDPFSRHLFDIAREKYWYELTAEQRAVSATTPRGLVWGGLHVRQAARRLLALGEITLSVDSMLSGFVGTVSSTSAVGPFKTFTAPIRSRWPDGLCESPPALPAPVQHVLVVAESECSPVELAEIGAVHGALAVVEVENGTQSPPPSFGSRDVAGLAPRIPVVRVSRPDGELLHSVVGSRVTVNWNEGSPAGADSEWRPYVYTPARPILGASLSHWDSALRPSALLEPNPAVDADPFDITLELAALVDLGWKSAAHPGVVEVADAGVDASFDTGAASGETGLTVDTVDIDASTTSHPNEGQAFDSGVQLAQDGAIPDDRGGASSLGGDAETTDADAPGVAPTVATPSITNQSCTCIAGRRGGDPRSWMLMLLFAVFGLCRRRGGVNPRFRRLRDPRRGTSTRECCG